MEGDNPAVAENPPPTQDWKAGLTKFSVNFINEAEQTILDIDKAATDFQASKSNKDFPKFVPMARGNIQLLGEAIDEIKSKKVVLTKPLSVREFFETRKLPQEFVR